jgi:hypothetical protein
MAMQVRVHSRERLSLLGLLLLWAGAVGAQTDARPAPFMPPAPPLRAASGVVVPVIAPPPLALTPAQQAQAQREMAALNAEAARLQQRLKVQVADLDARTQQNQLGKLLDGENFTTAEGLQRSRATLATLRALMAERGVLLRGFLADLEAIVRKITVQPVRERELRQLDPVKAKMLGDYARLEQQMAGMFAAVDELLALGERSLGQSFTRDGRLSMGSPEGNIRLAELSARMAQSAGRTLKSADTLMGDAASISGSNVNRLTLTPAARAVMDNPDEMPRFVEAIRRLMQQSEPEIRAAGAKVDAVNLGSLLGPQAFTDAQVNSRSREQLDGYSAALQARDARVARFRADIDQLFLASFKSTALIAEVRKEFDKGMVPRWKALDVLGAAQADMVRLGASLLALGQRTAQDGSASLKGEMLSFKAQSDGDDYQRMVAAFNETVGTVNSARQRVRALDGPPTAAPVPAKPGAELLDGEHP